MPPTARNSVDLPEPDGPVTRTRSPAATVKSSTASSNPAVGQAEFEVAGADLVIPGALDLDHRRRHRHEARNAGRHLEAAEPLDHRAPFGELGVGRDEEGQRILHPAEGGGGLHQAAELEGAGEIGRACDDERKHRRDLRIAGGEEGEALLAVHDRPPIAHHMGEALHQPGALGLLARQTARSARRSRAPAPARRGNRPRSAAGRN